MRCVPTISFTPLPFEAFDVFFDEGVTALHLDEGEGGKGFDGMVVLYRDDDGIACLYALLYAIEHKDAFALHKGPYFGTVVVDLIGDVLSRIERDAFSKGVVTIFVYSIVEDTVGAPTTFFVHGSGGEVLYGILDTFGTVLLAH